MLQKNRGIQGFSSESTGSNFVSKLFLRCLLLSVIAFGLVVFSPPLFAQNVSLAWDASESANVIAYRVHYGSGSGNYSSSTNVGNQTIATIEGLQTGTTYFFAVTALDNEGLESLPSNEVTYQVPISNPPPTIALTSPYGGSSYTAPATVNLAADVTANGHTISKVQFYNGATLLGEDASAPFSFNWSNVGAGNYSLRAQAVYGLSSTISSSPVGIVVINPLPVIVLTSPSAGSGYTAPATVNLAANVIANGHTISKVQFYDGTTLLGEDTFAPYSFNWSNVGAGSYSLSASAIYDNGSTVASSHASVMVTGLPAPWQTTDIGASGLPGGVSASGGTYTVTGAGVIGGTTDRFRFVYQTLSGDGEIWCRLTSIGSTDSNAETGVMIRESLAGGSTFAFMGLLPSGKFHWQERTSTSSSTTSKSLAKGAPPNVWVRLVRSGNIVSGFRSTDGSNWVQVSSRAIATAANIYVGLAVSSGGAVTPNTSSFSDVIVIP